MKTYLLTFIAFLFMVVAMAVGVILSNKKVQGSCGGLGNVMGEDCEFCDNQDECEDRIKDMANRDAIEV